MPWIIFSQSKWKTLSCAIQILLHPSPSIRHFLPLLLLLSILPHPIVLILFTDQNLTFLHFSKLIIWYPYPTSLWLLDHFLTCLPSLSSPTMKIDYPTGPCSFFFRSSHSFLSSHLSFLLQIRSFIQHPSRSIFSSLKQNDIEHFLLISLLHIIFFPNISTFLTLVG